MSSLCEKMQSKRCQDLYHLLNSALLEDELKESRGKSDFLQQVFFALCFQVFAIGSKKNPFLDHFSHEYYLSAATFFCQGILLEFDHKTVTSNDLKQFLLEIFLFLSFQSLQLMLQIIELIEAQKKFWLMFYDFFFRHRKKRTTIYQKSSTAKEQMGMNRWCTRLDDLKSLYENIDI